MVTDFTWHPNRPPPIVREHSKAKLAVLRKYLRAYFDRLGSNPARDEFRLDLVDGFAGGGTFLDGDATVSGTPLVMLEEARAADERLNRNRTKPLRFRCKFHFVDVNSDHTEHLGAVLRDRGYVVDGKEIVIHDSPFEGVADEIIADILNRQPRAGRALFLLDQCGFSLVAMRRVASIFERLPAAEVILTFATDALVNHLSETPAFVQAVAPVELTESHIRNLIELSNGDGGKALVQRVMREHIRNSTGATYDTPFFIRPKQSRRALWFLHLSRHPTARDVMIQCHWDSYNTFQHYGSGGFNMLGWDALNPEKGTLPLFQFDNLDAEQLRIQLLDSIPAELHALVAEDSITVDTMRHMLANRTAARFSDLDDVLLTLAREREIEILAPNGRVRSHNLSRIGPTDRIALPQMRLFPGLSRIPV